MKFGRFFYYLTGFALALSLTACGNNHNAAEQEKAHAESAAATESTAQSPAASPGTFKGKVLETKDAGSIVPFPNLKVTKAKGADAYTVGELFTKRKDLSGKTIEVKGQVVKVLKNIMGKNWIHIQDGTGDPVKNTHDLVITTQDSAAKGDIVTVKGTVEADKDFGSGYTYDVIVEDSKLAKDAAANEKAPQRNL